MRSVNCQVLDRVRSELARKVILDIDEGVWRQVDRKMGDQVQDSLFQIYYPLYNYIFVHKDEIRDEVGW